MVRWALVHPPYQEVFGPVSRTYQGEMPLGLAYIAAVLQAQGHEVQIVDAMGDRLLMDDVLARLDTLAPDVVGATCPTPLVPWVQALFDRVAERLPDAIRVCGGPHPTARPEDLFPHVHACVVGEAEDTVIDVSRWAEGDIRPASIPGLAMLRNGRTVSTGPRSLVEPLDRLPFPARHLFPRDAYSFAYPGEDEPYASVMTSRGCPHRCTFCATSLTFGRSVRYRSIDSVMDELHHLSREGVGFVFFFDDTFTLDTARTRALCRRIRDSCLGLRWACLARADRLDSDTLSLMHDAGCVEVQVGVESGDQRVLDTIGKGVTLDQLRHAFRNLRDSGIRSKGFFIYGLPGETPESAQRTTELALELDPDYAYFGVFVPFPGTASFPQCADQLLSSNWSDFCFFKEPVVAMDGISPEEVEAARRDAVRRFYFRPGKLLAHLPTFLTSPRRALTAAEAAVALGWPGR